MFRLLLFFLMISLPEIIAAADQDTLIQARELHYRGDIASGEGMIETLGRLLDDSSSPEDEKGFFFQTTLALYKGLLELDLNRREDSSATLEWGIALCFKGVDVYGTERLITLGAQLKSHWMLLQNTRTVIKTGGEIQDLTDRALDMNPLNPRALLLSAQGLVNAPRLFGGNPDKAEKLLLESMDLFRESYQKFDLFLTLASAARKKKDWQNAEMWCRRALSLYPDNIQGMKMLGDILNKRKS